ncbi:amidase [Cutaneotrichosporon oleaginosum]|uniref:Amidase n=1 Tax=Cutaneotrichosporon oleaginosum TaxID=879819 RepID=A0A0J0XVY3_9TREE|nr:amidase [Cutaneotrichosporon oleaginosum]KLT45198.1 amidase [Cutaneotrichosporon oleaginosum]TXT14966.1 hypothetical protein COLE_01159 [Cutaneotrichosporon oleaginosum]
MPYEARQLTINAKRLNDTIHETCEWGAAHRWGDAPTETGMCRLALSDDDKLVRDWFVKEMKSLGCEVKIDQMGSIFAIRKGKKDGPPTAMGSHLDTQPTGGRYDGILGVQSAVEAMRTIHEAGLVTEFPIAVVNWTNEEGARFPKSLHASCVWSGELTLEDAYALCDVANPGVSAGAELDRIGYKGSVPASHKANPLAAHFELHIEQGPVLESHNQRVGVVQGGQAYKWFTIRVNGRDSHAGTTPFDYRADPMLAASQFIVAAHQIAKEHHGLATTGIFHLQPGSINTIPNVVEFTLDIRHVDDAQLALIEKAIREASDKIAANDNARYKCSIDWEVLFDNPATKFHPLCTGAVEKAACASVPSEQVRKIVSGAGHDSCATSRICPTGMVFIPCREGLSHNPREYSTPEDCALGAQVLMDAALLFDSQRTA